MGRYNPVMPKHADVHTETTLHSRRTVPNSEDKNQAESDLFNKLFEALHRLTLQSPATVEQNIIYSIIIYFVIII